MAVEPEILIFDEPFSALDPLIRREMQDELLDIQKKLQRTMVFITHDFLRGNKNWRSYCYHERWRDFSSWNA